MDTKGAIEKEKLVRCKDCVNYPTMCGYYENKNKLHPCPDKGEGQHGFRPATEMNLKDTIYSFKMHMRGHDKNTALFDVVLSYLQQGEGYEQIVKEVKRIIDKNMFPNDKLEIIRENMNDLKQKYLPKPKKEVIK